LKKKNGLMRKAMELSVFCDCDEAIVMFSSTGKLCQFSSTDMDVILERYGRACVDPHERRNNDEVILEISISCNFGV
jgi:hypothetical protein